MTLGMEDFEPPSFIGFLAIAAARHSPIIFYIAARQGTPVVGCLNQVRHPKASLLGRPWRRSYGGDTFFVFHRRQHFDYSPFFLRLFLHSVSRNKLGVSVYSL